MRRFISSQGMRGRGGGGADGEEGGAMRVYTCVDAQEGMGR